jgi:hypothetical protein
LYDAHFKIKEIWKQPKINGVTIIPMQFVQLPSQSAVKVYIIIVPMFAMQEMPTVTLSYP